MSNYIKADSGADKIAHQIALEVPTLINWSHRPALYMERLIRIDDLCSETTRAYKAIFTLWESRAYGLTVVFRLNREHGIWKSAVILATEIKARPWSYHWITAVITWECDAPSITFEIQSEHQAKVIFNPADWVYYDLTSLEGHWVLVRVTKITGVPPTWKHAVELQVSTPFTMFLSGMVPQVKGFARPANIPEEQLCIAVEAELGDEVAIVASLIS